MTKGPVSSLQYQARTLKWALAGVLVLVCAAVTAFAASGRVPDGIIAEGVKVAGMDWGNKPTATAMAELEGWAKARLDEPVSLRLPASTGVSREWKPTRARLGAAIDVEGTVLMAADVGRDRGALTRLVSLFSRRRDVEIQPVWRVDPAPARQYLSRNVARKVRRAARDARFMAEGAAFKTEPGRPGTALDLDGSVQRIAARVTSESMDPVELAIRTVQPHISTEDLKAIQGEVSRFRTHYAESGNRARNIEVACRHLNGVALKPGDIFSYNKVVGPRESEGGFKMAPVIIKGRLEPGMGGGVCQTSSTLYNAVLLAGLKVVERTHHAFPVHYLPAGRDATVAYDDLDFKFQNDTSSTIAIAADGSDGRVTMRIFGQPMPPGHEIKIERTDVSEWGPGEETTHDSSVPAGRTRTIDSGHAGHRVTVWRSFYVNGVQVRRELLSHDTYQAFPRLVAAGDSPQPKKPASAENARSRGPQPGSEPVSAPDPASGPD